MIFSPINPAIFVTDGGEIYRHGIKKMGQYLSSSGYFQVVYQKDGTRTSYMSHRLVASAYCHGYAPGLEVNHINGIKTDNRAGNLEWVTSKQNSEHYLANNKVTYKRGESHYGTVFTDRQVAIIRARVAAGEQQIGIANELGVAKSVISNIINRKTWAHI